MAGREWTRVIAHVDLDAFFCQTERKLHPHLAGKPLGVAQYNPFGSLATLRPDENRHMNDSNGSLIAVSYEARICGVKRNMRGDEARKLCPDLQIVQVPTAHGKADLTAYRAAGKEVMDIMSEGGITAERASIDECYLDVTDAALRLLQAAGGALEPPPAEQLAQIYVCGVDGEDAAAWWQRPAEAWNPNELALAAGAAVVAAARARVEQKLRYTCSAGIAPTKILAKLCSGLHKPRQQTVLCFAAITGLLHDLPIPKLRQLGGKFGEDIMQALGIATVGELVAVPRSRLESAVGEEKAGWLARLAQGLDNEEVKARLLPKSVGNSKTFRGRSALTTLPIVHQWLLSIGAEVEERLQEDREANDRLPQTLTLGVSTSDWQGRGDANHFSRSCPLRKPTAAAIADDALAHIKRWAEQQPRGKWAIYGLSLSTSNFAAAPTGSNTLHRFMKPKTAGAVPASLPAKVQRRFDLAPSPPQQKLRPQSPLPKSGARNPQRRSLFPAAAARPAGAAAPASAAAPAAAAACRRSPAAAAPQPAAQPEVDPIAAWDAQQGAASAPAADSEGQSPDLQRSPGAVEPAAAAAAEPASDIEIDLDGEVEPPCDERRDGGAASTALGSAALSQPPCQPSSGQGNAAALFGGAAASGSQRAGASTAEQGPQAGSLAGDMARPDESGAAVASAQPAAAEGWMPSSLSEVDPAVLSSLPLALQAEIRHSLQRGGARQRSSAIRSFFQGGSGAGGQKKQGASSVKLKPSVKRKQSK